MKRANEIKYERSAKAVLYKLLLDYFSVNDLIFISVCCPYLWIPFGWFYMKSSFWATKRSNSTNEWTNKWKNELAKFKWNLHNSARSIHILFYYRSQGGIVLLYTCGLDYLFCTGQLHWTHSYLCEYERCVCVCKRSQKYIRLMQNAKRDNLFSTSEYKMK